jgi:hypothetical protein
MAQSNILRAKNLTGSTLSAGKVVYISGFDNNDQVPLIALASCDDESKMPAVGIVREDISHGDVSVIKITGPINSFDTSTTNINENVYVGQNGDVIYNDEPSTLNEDWFTQQLGTVIKIEEYPNGQVQLYPLEIKKRIKHPDLLEVTENQHHNKSHALTHRPDGIDPFIHARQHQIGGNDEISHGMLSGTSSGDDHTQYSLVNGTRNYTGIVSYSENFTFTNENQLITKYYVDSQIPGQVWRDPVIDKDQSFPPVFPNSGDRYIVASPGSGDWAGHDNEIAEYDGINWNFYSPLEGSSSWVKDEDYIYGYSGTSWAKISGGGVTGSGVSGYIAFWTGSSVLSGESNLYWDESSNRLGIGNSSPNESIDTSGAIKIGDAAGTGDGTIRWTGSDFEGRKSGSWISLTASSTSPSGSDGQVQYNNGGSFGGTTNIYYDDSTNKIGIGTNNPSEILTIAGNILIGGSIINSDLSETIQVILQSLDGYGVSNGGLNEQTFQENKNFWNNAIYHMQKDLDGYASNQTVEEHYIQYSSTIQDIIKSLDGYSYGGQSLNQTIQEHYNQHSDAIQIILKELDGYDSTISEHYQQHSGALQTILKELDGYSGAGLGVSEETFEQNKSFWNESIYHILTSLDGYGSGGGDVIKVGTPVNNQLGIWTGDGTIEGDSNLVWDGTAFGIGTDSPDSELTIFSTGGSEARIHLKSPQTSSIGFYETTSNAFATITGYWTNKGDSGSGHLALLTDDGTSHQVRIFITDTGNIGIGNISAHEKLTVNGIISLEEQDNYDRTHDGYGSIWANSDGKVYYTNDSGIDYDLTTGASDITISEHYQQHSDAIQTILKDLDGYVITTIENQHWIDGSQQRQNIRNALDGYSTTISGLDSVLFEHYQQHSNAIQTILKELDGYSGAGSGVSEETFEQNKLFWNESIYYILSALDGYDSGSGDASDITVSEHYKQHSDAIQTILSSLDGYGNVAGASDITVSEHYKQHSDAIQTILSSLDGYSIGSSISAEQGADGYLAFFTGSNSIAGDNDLFWDRENNRLGIGTSNAQSKLHIIGNGGAESRVIIEDYTSSIGNTILSSDADHFRIQFYNKSTHAFIANDYLLNRNSSGATEHIWRIGNSEVVRIDSTGLGVKRSPSTYPLEVNGDAGKTSGGTSWQSISDKRFKKEILPIIVNNSDTDGYSPLDRVTQLRGVLYKWITPENHGLSPEYDGYLQGFIAQEVEACFPEWVKTDQYGTKWLNMIGFEAYIVEALKEIKREIENTKSRLNNIEEILNIT